MSNEKAVKTSQLTNAVKQMSDYLKGKIDDNTTQLNATTQNITEANNNISNLSSTKAEKTDLDTERARINNFTKLAAGSTTGDAELTDARIGADGITYDNLGESVRSQFKDLYYLKEYSTLFDKNKLSGEEHREKVYNFKDNSESDYYTCKYIKYDVSTLVGKKLSINGFTATVSDTANFGLYAFYDENNNLIRSFGDDHTSYTNVEVVVPNGAKYLIVNGSKTRL